MSVNDEETQEFSVNQIPSVPMENNSKGSVNTDAGGRTRKSEPEGARSDRMTVEETSFARDQRGAKYAQVDYDGSSAMPLENSSSGEGTISADASMDQRPESGSKGLKDEQDESEEPSGIFRASARVQTSRPAARPPVPASAPYPSQAPRPSISKLDPHEDQVQRAVVLSPQSAQASVAHRSSASSDSLPKADQKPLFVKVGTEHIVPCCVYKTVAFAPQTIAADLSRLCVCVVVWFLYLYVCYVCCGLYMCMCALFNSRSDSICSMITNTPNITPNSFCFDSIFCAVHIRPIQLI